MVTVTIASGHDKSGKWACAEWGGMQSGVFLVLFPEKSQRHALYLERGCLQVVTGAKDLFAKSSCISSIQVCTQEAPLGGGRFMLPVCLIIPYLSPSSAHIPQSAEGPHSSMRSRNSHPRGNRTQVAQYFYPMEWKLVGNKWASPSLQAPIHTHWCSSHQRAELGISSPILRSIQVP